jgi:hypothetical protein
VNLGGCGGVDRSLSTGSEDGFSIEVQTALDSYSVKVHPIGKRRLHSLYLDHAGDIHFGTRDWPASPDSPLFVPRK